MNAPADLRTWGAPAETATVYWYNDHGGTDPGAGKSNQTWLIHSASKKHNGQA